MKAGRMSTNTLSIKSPDQPHNSMRQLLQYGLSYLGLCLCLSLLSSCTTSKNYEVVRHYNAANAFIPHYFYLKTPKRYGKMRLKRVARTFHEDDPRARTISSIIFRHEESYYAHVYISTETDELTILNFDARKPTASHPEYATCPDNCDVSSPQFVGAWTGLGTHNGLCYCLERIDEEFFKIINYLPADIQVDEEHQFFKEFEQFGDTSTLCYYRLNRPYSPDRHILYYPNDFGDLVIKEDSTDYVIGVYRQVTDELRSVSNEE